jgi:peptidoglycan/xylan/chitin deacetylase (PgdA/CDA1 family)
MLSRRRWTLAATAPLLGQALPGKPVVLTFDDGVRSHLAVVAPLLRKFGFGATFFVTHRWMDDPANFLHWAEIAELHRQGFEIGNHSWTHLGFNTPRAAARLEAELALVNGELAKVKVPPPVSFAWPGNAFCPEALEVLERLGYRYARRGAQPEVPYAGLQVGPGYQPDRHHRLLIPSTGDARPEWTRAHFETLLAQPGIPVLQFHGVPDRTHPWVHTSPEMFETYLEILKDRGYRGSALRELEPVARAVPSDPMRKSRHPQPAGPKLPRSFIEEHPLPRLTGKDRQIAPFPGHEHPRIGFLEGAIAPLRGTKAMAFLPWDPESYALIDVPEAIFAGKRLLFLAHTHIPSIWDERNITLEDRDWQVDGERLVSRWILPDTLDFGATLAPAAGGAVEMDLWLTNKTPAPFRELRSQVCVMLKRARGFAEQTQANKEFGSTIARARSGARSIAVEWDRCGRTWGNPNCPCIHSDPVFPDCAPGATVRARGRLWFEA